METVHWKLFLFLLTSDAPSITMVLLSKPSNDAMVLQVAITKHTRQVFAARQVRTSCHVGLKVKLADISTIHTFNFQWLHNLIICPNVYPGFQHLQSYTQLDYIVI
jgi:hypothetical protein